MNININGHPQHQQPPATSTAARNINININGQPQHQRPSAPGGRVLTGAEARDLLVLFTRR